MSNLKQEAFGGAVTNQFGGNQASREMMMNRSNAYLLFYERKSFFNERNEKIPYLMKDVNVQELKL